MRRTTTLLLSSLLAAGCGSRFSVDVKRDDASSVLVRFVLCDVPPSNVCNTTLNLHDVFEIGSGTGGDRRVDFNVSDNVGVVAFASLECSLTVNVSCSKWELPIGADATKLDLSVGDDGVNAIGVLSNQGAVVSPVGLCNGMNTDGSSFLPPGC